jgi:hypothetical protein
VGIFLAINWQRLTAKPIDAIEVVTALSDDTMEEGRFAEWIRKNIRASNDR